MRDLPSDGGTLRFVNSFNLSASKQITLNAAGGTIDTQGFTTTIAQGITGAGALTKAGVGTLVLSGNKTYAGGTTVSAGTLQLGDGTTNGSIVGNVTNDAALAFDSAAGTTMSYVGVISGTGAVNQIGINQFLNMMLDPFVDGRSGAAPPTIRLSALHPSAEPCRPNSRSPMHRHSRHRRRPFTSRAGPFGAVPMAPATTPRAIPL